MKSLLLIALFAFAAAEEEAKPVEQKLVYSHLPYAYAHHPLAYHTYHHTPLTYTYSHAPVTYTYQPVHTKFVPKEYEVEVKSFEFAPGTDCVNAFGVSVPCAKSKRSTDEEAEEEEKKVQVLPYYNTLPYNSFYHHPYSYTHYPYTAYTAPVVKVEPKIHEVEVPKPVFKHTVEKIPVSFCQNAWGFAVPCAK